MNETKIRNIAWDKASKEFDAFKNSLLKESKETIFDNAYKISMLSDFTDMFDPDNGCLSLEELKALLKEEHPVHTLYNYYMKSDAGGISDLYEAIWYRLNDLVEHNKSQIKKDFER